ncbi:ABC transporter permease [Fredinandcohnia humi]
MKHVLALTMFQLKALRNSWKGALALFLIPLLFVAGIAFIASKLLAEDEVVQLFDIAIVDQDDTFETKYVIQQLLKAEHLTNLTNVIQTDEASAKQLFDENKIAAMIVIPDGFSRSVKIGENTPVTVIGNDNHPLQAQLVRHLLESAADFTSAAQSGINTVYHFTGDEPFTKEEQQAEFRKSLLAYSLHILGRGEVFDHIEKKSLYQQSILHYYALSLFLLLLMVWSFGWLQLLKGKTTNSFRVRLLSRGITEVQRTGANLLSLFFILLPIALLGVIPLAYMFDSSPLLMMIALVVLVFVHAVFFIMLDSLFHSQQLYQLVGIGVLILGAFAGGSFIPTVYFPDWVEQLGAYTLNGFSLQFLLQALNGGSSKGEQLIKISLLSLCFMIVSLIGITIHKRRWSR